MWKSSLKMSKKLRHKNIANFSNFGKRKKQSKIFLFQTFDVASSHVIKNWIVGSFIIVHIDIHIVIHTSRGPVERILEKAQQAFLFLVCSFSTLLHLAFFINWFKSVRRRKKLLQHNRSFLVPRKIFGLYGGSPVALRWYFKSRV